MEGGVISGDGGEGGNESLAKSGEMIVGEVVPRGGTPAVEFGAADGAVVMRG